MPSEKVPKVYVFVSVSARRDQPGKRPRARWISSSESLVRMEQEYPEFGARRILSTTRREGHRPARKCERVVLSALLDVAVTLVFWPTAHGYRPPEGVRSGSSPPIAGCW